jgi:hypothetical protein
MKDIHQVDEKGNRPTVNGIHGEYYQPLERVGHRLTKEVPAWSEHGIVGRGILVDYYGWKASQSGVSTYNIFDSVAISVEELKACLDAQGTKVQFGDILFIRSGT